MSTPGPAEPGSADADASSTATRDDPRWRRDFPYTAAGEEAVARRDFTRYLVGASGAVAMSTVGIAVWSESSEPDQGRPRPVVPAADLPEGASHLFRFPTGGDPAIVVHRAGGEVVAYSQKCTHLGCVVYWDAEDDELVCPCHDGVFDPSTGDPIAGPPDRALPRIETEVRDDGMIWAIRRVEP